jgi:hypothetical protein
MIIRNHQKIDGGRIDAQPGLVARQDDPVAACVKQDVSTVERDEAGKAPGGFEVIVDRIVVAKDGNQRTGRLVNGWHHDRLGVCFIFFARRFLRRLSFHEDLGLAALM